MNLIRNVLATAINKAHQNNVLCTRNMCTIMACRQCIMHRNYTYICTEHICTIYNENKTLYKIYTLHRNN